MTPAKCFAGRLYYKIYFLGFLSEDCSQKIFYKVSLPLKVTKRLLTSLIITQLEATYTQLKTNAGLTKVAKPASVATGTA
jgi:hypothetical protein